MNYCRKRKSMSCETEQALYDAAHQASLDKQSQIADIDAQLLIAVADQTARGSDLAQAMLDKQDADTVVNYLQGQKTTKNNELTVLLTAEQQALTALQNCLGQQNP